MTEQQTLLSPKKPDGTTDWDVVFDDPDKGLIALINRVNTADGLRQCGQIMIKRLFTRKNDQLSVTRFTQELDDIISYAGAIGDLSEIKSEVVMMLQRIKAIRVAKARIYLEEKAFTNAENRRSSKEDMEIKEKVEKKSDFTPYILVGGIILITVIVAFIYWVTVFNPTNNETAQNEQTETPAELAAREKTNKKRQQDAAIQQEVDRKLAAIGKPRAEKKIDKKIMPPALVLPGIHVQPPGESTKNRKAYLVMPILVLADRQNMSDVCLERPKLVDIVNISLSKSITALSEGATINYGKIANSVRQQINQHMKQNFVIDVKLVSDGKTRDMTSAGERCKFATDRYLDYIYPPKTK